MARAAAGAGLSEACGLLLGRMDARGWHVREATVARNVSPAPGQRFEVEPAHLFQMHRAARAPGAPAIVGLWHSHPRGPACPSAHDRDGITEPDWLWVILADSGAAMAGWRPWPAAACGFRRVPLWVEGRIDLAGAGC